MDRKIAIYGAGSMGTVLGSYLSKAGTAADLISRDKEHIEALKKTGARIGGLVSFSVPPFDGKEGRGLAMLPEEMKDKYDIIFLLTKQVDNAKTARILGDFLTPKGILCTLQNGIPETALAEILGEDRVAGCICVWGAGKTAPGVVDITSDPKNMNFGLGSINGECPMLDEIQSILEKMCPVIREKNFIGVRWSKLVVNAALTGLSVITGFHFGTIVKNRKSNDFALRIVKECIDVCSAANVKIEPVQGKDIVRLMNYKNSLQKFICSLILPIATRKHHKIRSSMLPDLDRGRKCEIDYVNGVVCSWGKKYGVPTPCNDRIVQIVHSIERGERKYCPQNLDLLYTPGN